MWINLSEICGREENLLIDTDILIWYFRGNENARKIIYANIPFRISVISYIELLQGAGNKKELRALQKQLKNWSTEIIQIHDSISTRAMFFVEDYFLSNSLEFQDAIIAATTIETNDVLLTANYKHYGFIPNLRVNKFRAR